jgi:SHS2 domain-containing protein
MVNWLRELLYMFNGNEQIISAVTIEDISEKKLTAQVMVEPFSARCHRVRNEIKAVTYHQIHVGPVQRGWLARVIFDV